MVTGERMDTDGARTVALVKERPGLATKGPSQLLKGALDGLPRVNVLRSSGPARTPFHVLYADRGLDNIFHNVVLQALGTRRHIFPVWASHEQEIRHRWTERHFHCAFLVLNNIIVPDSPGPEERIRAALALIPWLRERSSATIIALSGWRKTGIGQEALRGGADRFLLLPFPSTKLLDFLNNRFGDPGESSE